MNVIKRLCYFYFPMPSKGTSYSVRHHFLIRNRSISSLSIPNIPTINECQIPEISANEMKSKIRTRWKYSEGHTCLKIDCPSCFLSGATKKNVAELSKLSINSKTGNLFCTQCFLHGSWQAFDTYLQALNLNKPGSGVTPSK